MDETFVGHLITVLKSADSPSNQVQQEVMRAMNEASARADFGHSLAFILATGEVAPLDVRQRAGLLLKSQLACGTIPPSIKGVRELSLQALADAHAVIRRTGGSIITTLVTMDRDSGCSDVLRVLVGMLSDQQTQVSEGAFDAISKICEDLVDVWRQTSIEHTEQSASIRDFITFSKSELVPAILRWHTPKRIVLLNIFALNFLLFPNQPLSEFLVPYFETVGQLAASEKDPEVTVAVCKGLAYICQQHPDLIGSALGGVFSFVLSASKHTERSIRLEGIQFWTIASLNADWLPHLRGLLPELLPILLQNMIYSQEDYLAMDDAVLSDDNAAVPDRPEEMAPRFHKEKGDGEDDDDDDADGGSTWGNEWTVRKAAASALDHVATAFRDDILPFILPLIEKMLTSENWEVQESALLALGAIGHGCMQGLSPHLPSILSLLVTISASGKPLLRSISCWTISRFAAWFAFDTHRQTALPSALGVILTRMMDHNKRVQEAAVSAFVSIEEEAGIYLADHLPNIIKAICSAMAYYQSKNLLILLDAIACLFESVGSESMSSPDIVNALAPAIVAAFQGVNVTTEKQLAVSLFECLTAMTGNIGGALGVETLTVIVRRCMDILNENVVAFDQITLQAVERPKPDSDILACALDLLCGALDGLSTAAVNLVSVNNFIPLLAKLISQFEHESKLPKVRNYYSNMVKQCAFALLGDCARTCIVLLTDELVAPIVPTICAYVTIGPILVSNNSSWCLGEISMRKSSHFVDPFVPIMATALVSNLKRFEVGSRPIVRQNAAIAIGRIGVTSGVKLASLGVLNEVFTPWCEIMRVMRTDDEKVSAVNGFLTCLRANPQSALSAEKLLALHQLFGSVIPPPNPLQISIRETIFQYRSLLGDSDWSAMWSSFPTDLQYRLNHAYGLGLTLTQPPPPPDF
jgi:transportin-1